MRLLFYVFCLATAASLFGCSGKTTDPREGGLFSYNPEAYEKRIQERQDGLSKIEMETSSEKDRKKELEASKKSKITQKENLEADIASLSANITNLDETIRSTKTKTAAQELERDRILKDIGRLKVSSELVDDLENDEEKQLEIERLKKLMDELEKEAEALMTL